MAVFILIYQEIGYSEVTGVFSTREKAEVASKLFDIAPQGHFDIVESTLDFIIT